MKTWLLLLLGLLLRASAVRAQGADFRPALRRALAQARTDSARGRLNVQLSSRSAGNDSIIYFAQRAIPQLERAQRATAGAERRRLLNLLADAANNLAASSHYRGEPAQSIRWQQRVLALRRQAGSVGGQVRALLDMGNVYYTRSDYLAALRSYQQGVRVGENAPAAQGLVAMCLTAVGAVYARLGNGPAALRYQREALRRLARTPPENKGAEAEPWGMLALADTYLTLFDDTARTEYYARRGQQLAEHAAGMMPKLMLTNALALRGQVRVRQQRWAAARQYLLRAQAQAIRVHDQIYLPEVQNSLALVEEGSGNLPLALRYARQADSYGQRSTLKTRSQSAEILARLYEKLNQPRPALLHVQRFMGLRDSLNNEVNKRRAVGQMLRNDYERRTAALRAEQAADAAQLHRQHLLLWGLLAGAGLLALLAAGQWRGHRRQQQANALLAAQKAQLTEQARRLGELDEAKNQFFANVSHELRTPLTLILGPLDDLLTAPLLPAAVRQPVALAHRHAERLRELVNRILDLTKLQAGRLTLHPEPTAPAALLRRVVGQFESLAEQRGVALHGPVGLPGSLRLLFDADKVEQILTNLLINAFNHTPAGGRVEVAAELPGPDGQCVVRVCDTGPGIAAAEQERVFERYYQSPQGAAQGGTGLGLALSRELAHLLGGSLTLASGPGPGAAFTLRFPAVTLAPVAVPAAEASATETPAAEMPETGPPAGADAAPDKAPTTSLPAVVPGAADNGATGAGPRPRVLVVEDQPDLRAYLHQLLSPTCEVLTAVDGQAARDLLAGETGVELLVTDAMMPRLTGVELLAYLRADPAWAGVPVLMLTARADEAHRLHALTVGVDDYLTKPFVASELLTRVQALLARYQTRRRFAALPPAAEAEPAPSEPAEAVGSRRNSGVAPAPAPVVVAAAPEAALPTAAAQLAQWQALVSEQLADERFGPPELAELLCLSERTLYRRLGELAGLTPAAWLRELRLDRARHLLEAGGFGSVAAVADAAGFGSTKYFAVLYTERFGRRPSSYLR